MSAGHFLKDDWRDAVIEEKIRPLVRSLNNRNLGIRTIAACQGHLKGPASPYVRFQCSVKLAAIIDKRLRDLWREERGPAYHWMLEGHFNHRLELGFSIRAPRLQRVQLYPWPPLYVYWLARRKIDADLAILAKAMDDLFSEIETGKAMKTTGPGEPGSDFPLRPPPHPQNSSTTGFSPITRERY